MTEETTKETTKETPEQNEQVKIEELSDEEEIGMSESEDNYGLTGTLGSSQKTQTVTNELKSLSKKQEQAYTQLRRQRKITSQQRTALIDLEDQRMKLEKNINELSRENEHKNRLIKDQEYTLRQTEARLHMTSNETTRRNSRRQSYLKLRNSTVLTDDINSIPETSSPNEVTNVRTKSNVQKQIQEYQARNSLHEQGQIRIGVQKNTTQTQNDPVLQEIKSDQQSQISDMNALLDEYCDENMQCQLHIENLETTKTTQEELVKQQNINLENERKNTQKLNDKWRLTELQYEELIRKLSDKIVELLQRLRDQYHQVPSRLPKQNTILQEYIVGNKDINELEINEQETISPILVYKGVIKQFTVGLQGPPVIKSQYAALFCVGEGESQFKLAPFESSFNDYFYSTPIISYYFNEDAISQLKIFNSAGKVLADAVENEDISRLMLIETLEKRFIIIFTHTEEDNLLWKKALDITTKISKDLPSLLNPINFDIDRTDYVDYDETNISNGMNDILTES